MNEVRFPEDFLFGTATAAAQIEGAAFEDGKTASMWDTFCRKLGAIDDSSTIDVACDHYHRMREDVALMRELGMSTYRFSVSWPRVATPSGEPKPEGLRFYSELVDELLAAGITPWLTLYHWDLPAELDERGGWTARKTAEHFARYARTVYDALGDRVRYWTTLNEPWCSAFLGYLAGEHAPGHTDMAEALTASHHLMLAHGLALKQLRAAAAERNQDIIAGITLNFTVAHPADPACAADLEAQRRVDGAQNRFFADPLFRGSYPSDVLADVEDFDMGTLIEPGDMDIISAPIDVLGVNFYSGTRVAGVSGEETGAESHITAAGETARNPLVGGRYVRQVLRDLPRTDMGWEVNADDLRALLVRIHRDYTGPAGVYLVVTENGSAWVDEPDEAGFVDDTSTRLAYLRDHLLAVADAQEEGADVRGYLTWSLLDNFEWARGYTKRFGIVRVDYDTLERIPKASALWYSRVATTHVVPAQPEDTQGL